MNGTPDISISGILAGLLLLLPAVFLVWKFKLGLNKKLLISTGRMLLQLGFVAVYLIYIFKLNNAYVNVGYLCLMVFFAAFSAIKNSGLVLKEFLATAFAAMLVPTLLIMIYFNTFVVQLSDVFKAELFIPIGGMMLGNTLKSNIVALKTFFNLLKKEEKVYQYLLAAGATRMEALRPLLKEAVRTAMAPNIATMATAGLVSLPGVMTGQIIGGSAPALAVKYQVMVMLLVFVTGLVSILLQLLFAVRKAFDPYDRFRRSLIK